MQLLPVIYFSGVVLLIRRQFAQEKQAREGDTDSAEPKEPIAHEAEPSTATEVAKGE